MENNYNFKEIKTLYEQLNIYTDPIIKELKQVQDNIKPICDSIKNSIPKGFNGTISVPQAYCPSILFDNSISINPSVYPMEVKLVDEKNNETLIEGYFIPKF